MSEERFARVEAHFKNNGAKTLVIGKFIYGFETVTLAAAGAAHMPYLRFTFYTILPSIPKSFLFAVIGYYFGHAYNRISDYLDNVAMAMAIIVAAGIVLFFIYRRFYRRVSKKAVEKL